MFESVIRRQEDKDKTLHISYWLYESAYRDKEASWLIKCG